MKVEYKVTTQGSLGLLALGHIGIKKWKEANENLKAEANSNKLKKNHVQKKK